MFNEVPEGDVGEKSILSNLMFEYITHKALLVIQENTRKGMLARMLA